MIRATRNEDPAHKLYEAIAKLHTAKEAEMFLQDLCTPSELQAIADRWRVVGPIKAGIPYRQIYEETGVSVTTVGRVARCIMLGTGGYNLIFERVEKQRYDNKAKTQNRGAKKRPP